MPCVFLWCGFEFFFETVMACVVLRVARFFYESCFYDLYVIIIIDISVFLLVMIFIYGCIDYGMYFYESLIFLLLDLMLVW